MCLECEKCITGNQSNCLNVVVAGVVELADHLVHLRQSATVCRRCAPQIQNFDREASSLATGRQQEEPVRFDEAFDVAEQGDTVLDLEVVNVVVERYDIEALIRFLLSDVDLLLS